MITQEQWQTIAQSAVLNNQIQNMSWLQTVSNQASSATTNPQALTSFSQVPTVPGGMVGMAGMLQNQQSPPFNPAAFMPQEFFQNLLMMSSPVGSSTNDDTLLAQALFDSKKKGQTYRQALESLHGVNSHSGHSWKDYYLDHHERINLLVSRLEEPKTVKKPSFLAAPSSSYVEAKSHRRSSHDDSPQETRKRLTFNSITAPSDQNLLNVNLLPPHQDIRIPRPPSRSPSPPRDLVAAPRGYKYTDADKKYFIDFIGWHLNLNPFLSKQDLCLMISEKASHHSSTSWLAFWSRMHDLADKIQAAARAKIPEVVEVGNNAELGSDDEVLENQAGSARPRQLGRPSWASSLSSPRKRRRSTYEDDSDYHE